MGSWRKALGNFAPLILGTLIAIQLIAATVSCVTVAQTDPPTLTLTAFPSTLFTSNTTTITATVTGAEGKPVAGATVTFNASGVPGDFEYSPPVLKTNDNGKAAIKWTARKTPGNATIYASVPIYLPLYVSILRANVTVTVQNQPPASYIDSIKPNPAKAGEKVTFTGHGADPDGTIVGYRWASSIDGLLSSSASFSTSSLSVGNHIISFQVQDNGGAWSDPVSATLRVEQAINGILIATIAGGVATLGAAMAFRAYYRGRPPSSDKIERDLEQKRGKQKEEEKEEKLKSKKGEPHLVWSVAAPTRIMGSIPSRAIVDIQNRGLAPANDVLITVASTTGVALDKKTENIPELKPNERRSLIFPFNISEQAKKGVYTLRFVAESKQTPTQVKRSFLRAVKIGILSDPRKPQYAEPLKSWLKGNAYGWDDLASAEDFLKLVRYDLLIVAPELEVSPKGIRNISNFVENGQCLLVVDKIITPEQEMLARTLGYHTMQYEPFKSSGGFLTIVNNQNLITRRFAVGGRIPLGPSWGNACASITSTGQTLAVQVIKTERENVTITVPAITINRHGKGKALHLNFHAENSVPQLNTILKIAIYWLLSAR